MATTTDLALAAKDLAQTIQQAERERHISGVLTAIDEAGRPVKDAFRAIIPPETLRWTSNDMGGFQAIARAGRPVLAVARATTGPSTGRCVITLAWESEVQGLTTLGTVGIPNGKRFGQAGPSEITTGLPAGALLPAGAWIRATVSTANGASGVSVTLALEN